MFSLLVLLAPQVLLEDLWPIRVTIIVPARQPGDSEDIKTAIFYIYVPKGMFWGSTSRPNIGDLVINLLFNLGSNVHDWGWLKNGPFWTKNGRLLNAPKWSKMVNLTVIDHLGSFWAHLGASEPFQTKTDFFLGLSECWPCQVFENAPHVTYLIWIWKGAERFLPSPTDAKS